MCVICKDWHLGKLNIDEAWRNLKEFRESSLNSEDEEHYWQVAEMLSELSN